MLWGYVIPSNQAVAGISMGQGILFDNSLNKGERVAFGGRQLPTKIKDIVKFKIIKDYE